MSWPSLLQPGGAAGDTGGLAGTGTSGGNGSPSPLEIGGQAAPGDVGGVNAVDGTSSGASSGAPGPPGGDWFAALADLDCARIKGGSGGDETVLVRALYAVCPAVLPKGRPDWPTADAADRELADRPTGENQCRDAVGTALLHQLVTLHRAHPDALFHTTASSGTRQCTADG